MKRSSNNCTDNTINCVGYKSNLKQTSLANAMPAPIPPKYLEEGVLNVPRPSQSCLSKTVIKLRQEKK